MTTALPTRPQPTGEFMTPLPLTRPNLDSVPLIAGCHLVYLDDQPYYAGMSRTNMRARLRAHVTGRGAK